MASPKAKNIDRTGMFIWNDSLGKYEAWDGIITASETAVVDTPEYFEDTNFVTGDSPATLDINTALGRNATSVTIWNDGPGNFTYSLSNNGAVFGDDITITQADKAHVIEGISIDSLRITWVADSAYRVTAI